jgi:TRAP-type mannitol/chloroaromatic compound transport system permease large subunit
MLVAGFLPGLMLTGLFLIYVLVRVRMTPSLAPEVDADVIERKTGSVFMALVRMLPCCFVFFMVMGLIMLGVATPTEAAATGVAGAIMLAAYYRGLSLHMLWEALASAATVASLLLVIMCSAVMFSQLLTFTGATRALGQFVVGLELSAALMLLAMLALPFVLFMFLDQIALMLVLIPIYQPILKIYEFDPIWFWTLFLVVATVGGLTPPFGYVLFALKSAAPDVPMGTIFRASWPFVGIICAGMLIMALVPDIITFLPRLMTPR